jgi:ligand-binding sensor domain-containing protein
VSPVKYQLDFHIPEDGSLHGHRRENLISYVLFRFKMSALKFGTELSTIRNKGLSLQAERHNMAMDHDVCAQLSSSHIIFVQNASTFLTLRLSCL